MGKSNVRTAVGTMVLDGAEYAVLSRAEGNPEGYSENIYAEAKVPRNTFLVSRVFSEHANEEGIEVIRRTYAAPHWITMAGGAIIHWANDVYAVETLPPNVTATEEPSE